MGVCDSKGNSGNNNIVQPNSIGLTDNKEPEIKNEVLVDNKQTEEKKDNNQDNGILGNLLNNNNNQAQGNDTGNKYVEAGKHIKQAYDKLNSN